MAEGMGATGADPKDLISDDFAALYECVRLAWLDEDEGVKALRDLKAGKIGMADIEALIQEWSRNEHSRRAAHGMPNFTGEETDTAPRGP